MTESLRSAGMDVSVVDSAHYPEGGVDVKGTGTTSEDLRAAGIDRAVGLVAGNASDTKNLAIAVTARALNHDLYIINRQNLLNNAALFDAFHQDLLMVPSRVVAQEFLARITTPLLQRFLKLLPQHNEAECAAIWDELANLDPGRHRRSGTCRSSRSAPRRWPNWRRPVDGSLSGTCADPFDAAAGWR